MIIRRCSGSDAEAVCAIYNHYVTNSVATFEEEPVAVPEMQRRITEVTASLPWLVDEQDGTIAGYAYAAPWKARPAYRHSVESTVYVAPDRMGRGTGTRLYRALIAALRDQGVHAVVGGIALPNPASVALHEKLGFAAIGRFREVGFKLGRWVDVGYWELLL